MKKLFIVFIIIITSLSLFLIYNKDNNDRVLDNAISQIKSKNQIAVFLDCDYNDIISAHYYINELSGNSKISNVSLNQMFHFWRSSGIKWSDGKNSDIEVCKHEVNNSGYKSFDITEFVKSSIADKTWVVEQKGLLLKGDESEDENNYKIFGTSDNSLYPPYVEIKFSKLPYGFKQREKINEIE